MDEKMTVGKALDLLFDGDRIFDRREYLNEKGYQVLDTLQGVSLVQAEKIRAEIAEFYRNPDLTEAEENLLDDVIAIIDKHIDEYNEPLDD